SIADRNDSAIGILLGVSVARVHRLDSNKVSLDLGEQRAVDRDGPRLDMALEEVGVALEERCGRLVAALAREAGCGYEGGDVRGQGRRGIAGGFTPAVLWGAGPLLDQVAGSPNRQGVGVVGAQGARLVQLPSQQDREGHLVELRAAPIGLAIDPE